MKENKEINDNKLDQKNMNNNFIAKIMSVCYNLDNLLWNLIL